MNLSDHNLPDHPDISSLDPQMMTAQELQTRLEELFSWLHEVESAREPVPDHETVQAVRDAANLLLEERRDRHEEESGLRGS